MIVNGLGNKKKTEVKVFNSPAYIDSLIIEYAIKEYGQNPFVIIDRQVERDFKLYADAKGQSGLGIMSNLITDEFINETVRNDRRLKRTIKVFYSNLPDKIGSEVENQYFIERVEFLSKKTKTWYLKNEKESAR